MATFKTFALLMLNIAYGIAYPLTYQCIVSPDSGSPIESISGTVTLTQQELHGVTTFALDLSGFNTADEHVLHGFHIHEFGNLTNGCVDAGGHYNPDGSHHGAPHLEADSRHVGDLGNIEEGADGTISILFDDHLVELSGYRSVVGRAIVIHEKADDLGLVGDEGSLTTGNAGGRIGCCIIE